jgi:Fe-S cluster assembly iron-binding protein IscA
MLTVTVAASAALASLLESPEIPAGAVPRLVQGRAPDGEPAIGLTIVSDPDPADEVVAAGRGVEVFIEPAAVDALDDQQLDVERDHERVSFSLRSQPPNGGPPGGNARNGRRAA